MSWMSGRFISNSASSPAFLRSSASRAALPVADSGNSMAALTISPVATGAVVPVLKGWLLAVKDDSVADWPLQPASNSDEAPLRSARRVHAGPPAISLARPNASSVRRSLSERA